MKAPVLLTRDAFREGVFARDDHKCVICGEPAVDAHHIIERRLWPDGGYYLENGASVCEKCHRACEKTEISVEQVREAAGIKRALLPPHLYPDQVYDKWGNPVMPNGQRLRGELFHDESVQKILAAGGVLDLFTNLVKYPRTYHLPWSPGVGEDDRVMESLEGLEGRRVIVAEKMDGQNITMRREKVHGRSVDGRPQPSQDWVKQFWSTIASDIPEDWRVCGENLFAKHSIAYEDLPTFFMGFSVWDGTNTCLAWDDTMEWFELLGITPVPVLYDGIFDAKLIQGLWSNDQWDRSEGYTVRDAGAFSASQFKSKMGKFVRPGHLQTVRHGNRILVKNALLAG